LVKALPDSSNLIVSIKEVCAGQPVVVELSGLGALTAITINILYLVQIIWGSNGSFNGKCWEDKLYHS
jgi:hypothetical protein